MPRTSVRDERRQQRHNVGREQLLDAAEELFSRKGFHDTTLREVAELAEFSVGSVYSFFENKDDLFRQIFVRRGDEFMPAMHAIVDDIQTPALDALHALIDFEVGFFRAHPAFGRLFLRYSSATTMSVEHEIDVVVRERFEEAMTLQAHLFERGQRARKLCAGDPAVLARLFSGLISAYQALDPAVVSGEPHERLPLSSLHAIVEAAFRIRK